MGQRKGKRSHFLVLRERKREREGKRDLYISLRSIGFHRSEFVEPRLKVHILDEDYVWVPKRKDFD